ncbi:MAG: hypothetical protein AAFU49_02185 [Pseudomonadota bacterium]
MTVASTKRFRLTVFALIGAAIVAVVAFKAWHVSAAFQHWEGQQLHDTPGAAK